MKLQLWQLTDTEASIEGYMQLPVFMETTSGDVLCTEVEVYIVPNMTISLLLSEDYLLNHEVQVSCNVEDGSSISFRKTSYKIRATPVNRTKDFDRLRESAYGHASFIKAKLHKWNKDRRQWKNQQKICGEMLLQAKDDCKISGHSSRVIPVEGYFEDGLEYYVKKTLLSNNNGATFTVVNSLFHANFPVVSVSNTSNKPRYIKKGEILASVLKASDTFKIPGTEDRWDCLQIHAMALATFISSQLSETETKNNNQDDPKEEMVRPKTTEMPDPEVYSSENLKEYLDVGDLPTHLEEKAWGMLNQHQNVFALDGHLG